MSEEKTYYGGNIVYLKFIEAKEYLNIPDRKPSSVHIFPIKDDQVLLTINPRGSDIIGGHIEKGESIIEALKRESMEEACIILNDYDLIGAIRVDNRDNPKAIEQGYPAIGYQLFYKSDNFKMLDFVQTHECTGREYVKIDELKNKHHKWLNTHEQIIEEMIKKKNVRVNKPRI